MLESDIVGVPPHGAREEPQPVGSMPLASRVEAVVRAARTHAAAVDAEARFPAEAMAVIKAGRLLGLAVPDRLGGEGAAVGVLADVCFKLGRACASTGMIYAMHVIMLSCVLRHGQGNPWQERLLARICDEQLLLASSTTEGSNGGNMRSTVAPMVWDEGRVRFARDASVMSYGIEADVIVTTARRSDQTHSTDQVMAVFPKADVRLTATGTWDTLGMRGTCSGGFAFEAEGSVEQVLAEAYEIIHAQTTMPTAHVMWGAVWAGIAAAAVAKAQAFVRKAARQSGGQMPPGAVHLARAVSSLHALRGRLASAARGYDAALAEPERLATLAFRTEMSLLKVEASEAAVATIMTALRVCGLSGYRNDGDASLGRHLRDVLSAPLMINNDRILDGAATAALLIPIPDALGA